MTDSLRLSFSTDRTLLVALRGWNDAGEAASTAVTRVEEGEDLDRLVVTIDDEVYFDYAVARPRVETAADGRRVLRWPGVRIAGARGDVEQRLYTLTGIEPSLRWRSFAAEIVNACRIEGINNIVIVGALLADAPHTRDIRVSVTSDDPQVRSLLGIDPSTYEGPTGIPSVLAEAARAVGMRVVSLWAAVPHYTSAGTDWHAPKATLALLDELAKLLEIEFDRSDLEEEAEIWEDRVDDAVAADDELVAYVRYLEDARDVMDSEAATGDAIAAEFERFLAKDDDPDAGGLGAGGPGAGGPGGPGAGGPGPGGPGAGGPSAGGPGADSPDSR